ncbi:hypothetical protein [Streptomyces sp. N35]|uniref:hypothetical protein n=1 Tax=Streptomyces sp. N35 TaxID=2795730 RepID=UPI0018F6A706|nr:hypothetical protein [Streptomyces sp. N35]
MKLKRHLRKCLFTLAAMPAVLALSISPAQAADTGRWDITGNNGDLKGVWAHGNLWQNPERRFHLYGEVKDTVGDGKGAALKIDAYYKDGGHRPEVVTNTLGAGKVVTFDYNFASNVDFFLMRECFMVRNEWGDPVLGECAAPAFWRDM